MARRVRRHANPFNCTVDLGRLDRLALFGREAPLEVEIGPGAASFLLDRARNNPDRDFVGIEVRKPMVEQTMARRDAEGITNAVILYANANVNLDDLADPGVITMFHVHFPDPWVKKKHWKRRQLNPRVVRAMVGRLPIGGRIYAQSDVGPLAEEMFRFLSAEGALGSKLDPTLVVARPVEESTDWERHHENVGEPVYRMLFEKIREAAGPIPDLSFGPTGPLVSGLREESAD